jgi:hypothetical protein
LFERYGDVQAFVFHPGAAAEDPKVVANTADTYTKMYGFYDLMIIADAAGKIIAVEESCHTQLAVLIALKLNNNEHGKLLLYSARFVLASKPPVTNDPSLLNTAEVN